MKEGDTTVGRQRRGGRETRKRAREMIEGGRKDHGEEQEWEQE